MSSIKQHIDRDEYQQKESYSRCSSNSGSNSSNGSGSNSSSSGNGNININSDAYSSIPHIPNASHIPHIPHTSYCHYHNHNHSILHDISIHDNIEYLKYEKNVLKKYNSLMKNKTNKKRKR